MENRKFGENNRVGYYQKTSLHITLSLCKTDISHTTSPVPMSSYHVTPHACLMSRLRIEWFFWKAIGATEKHTRTVLTELPTTFKHTIERTIPM